MLLRPEAIGLLQVVTRLLNVQLPGSAGVEHFPINNLNTGGIPEKSKKEISLQKS